jgi:hypothetical protein
VYLALTWQRPNRTLIALLFGAGFVGASVVSLLPRERIVRSRYREAFFLGWSLLDLVLISIGALEDGGSASPLALVSFMPVVFAAMSCPLGSVLIVGGLSVAGYLALAVTGRVEGLESIVPWIRHSHESFDGSGYPDGLRGEQIPLASRIMLVADAFDAITSTRPYRAGLSVAHAREELASHAGTQFDPRCVDALLECLDDELLVRAPRLALA